MNFVESGMTSTETYLNIIFLDTPVLFSRCLSSTSPIRWQLLGRMGRGPSQRDWGSVLVASSPYPGRCSSCRSWKFETDWPPHKSTSSSTSIPVRACRAELTPTWWGSRAAEWHGLLINLMILIVCFLFYSWRSRRCRCVQSLALVVQSAVCGSACCHYDLTLTRWLSLLKMNANNWCCLVWKLTTP